MPVSRVPEGSGEEIYYWTGLRTTAGGKQPKATQRNPAKGNRKRADLCVSPQCETCHQVYENKLITPPKKKKDRAAVGWISILLSPSISVALPPSISLSPSLSAIGVWSFQNRLPWLLGARRHGLETAFHWVTWLTATEGVAISTQNKCYAMHRASVCISSKPGVALLQCCT